MKKVMQYREVLKRLRNHDTEFIEYTERGKGSHRMIVHPNIDGRKKSFPLPCHNRKSEITKPYLVAMIRRFQLPKDIFD